MNAMICTSCCGQPQPLEAGEQVVRLGGRGQGEAGEHAERALDQQRAGRPRRPGSLTLTPEHLDLRPGRDERQQQREDHERHLDDHPLEDVRRRHRARRATTPTSTSEVDREGRRTSPAGWRPRRA